MSFQGKILFIIAFSFLVHKACCEKGNTEGLHVYLTRDVDEAGDLIDADDNANVDPAQNSNLDEFHSPEAMQLLTEEYIKLVETELASATVERLMKKFKEIVTNEKAVNSFKNIELAILQFLTNPHTSRDIKKWLKTRFYFYVSKKTPALLEERYRKARSFVNDENIKKRVQFGGDMLVKFFSQPDVQQKILDNTTLISKFIFLPKFPNIFG